MIISVAYSIPAQRRSSRRYSSGVKPRSPQYTSWMGERNHHRASRVKRGLPIHRCDQGMAPGSTRPPPAGRRQPWTSSAPARHASTKRGISVKS